MRGRVYDPRLGRFLSPDPLVATPNDLQSLNRYAYVRNNPLSLVDPTGFFAEPPASGGASAFGGFETQIASGFTSAWSAFGSGVAAVGSFLSSSWGGVRFGATAAWNGLSWLGSQLSQRLKLGRSSGAGGRESCVERVPPTRCRRLPGGILPDEKVPGGIAAEHREGVRQFSSQELEVYDVVPQAGGAAAVRSRHARPDHGGNLYVNGQLNERGCGTRREPERSAIGRSP